MRIYTLCQIEIKKIREATGMNRKEFCKYFNIPYRTVTEWERGTRREYAGCESLPKSGKYAEKGRKIRIRRLRISTQTAKIC